MINGAEWTGGQIETKEKPAFLKLMLPSNL